MKIRNKGSNAQDKIDIQMTPMIDIVFQLLIFFIMSFKISTPEGDFSIKMPQAGTSAAVDETVVTKMRVKLQASSTGDLASVQVDRVTLSPTPSYKSALRQYVMSVAGNVGPNGAQDVEVELDCDYELKYQYVIMAITAVSGYVKDGNIYKLVENIKFSPPKRPAGS